MEKLIKSFLKYSRLYRNCDNRLKKKQIYNKWIEDVVSVKSDKPIHIDNNFEEKTNKQEQNDVVVVAAKTCCEFCYAASSSTWCCDQCFYPRCKRLMGEEFATYLLLSVCFFEENEIELINDGLTIADYVVWLQRLRLAWFMHQNCSKPKIYKIVHEKCIQCDKRTLFSEYTTHTFNWKLFCQRCMFPLFSIN
ncbi:hypothetical protein Gyru_ORF35 [Gynaephora ruoergensis nucleopolyhedrovirus]|nr:hypothetical protein Gyru_ORF35 [Gynaephora ruoergensis nucleopolyhedrovirus]